MSAAGVGMVDPMEAENGGGYCILALPFRQRHAGQRSIWVAIQKDDDGSFGRPLDNERRQPLPTSSGAAWMASMPSPDGPPVSSTVSSELRALVCTCGHLLSGFANAAS